MPFDRTRTLDASDGNYMVIGGIRYPIINSEIEAGRGEDRVLWRIVTEGCEPVQLTEWERDLVQSATQETEEQPPAADATAHSSNCMQRGEQHDAHAWSVNDHTYQCDGASAYASRPSLGICDEALKILGVNPYDYTGGANFRDSGGIPPRPSGLMVPPLPCSPPREG